MTRILIVDDHEVVRRGLEQILAEGFGEPRFGSAATAPAALDRLSRETWDLLLLDVNLPGRGGLELLEEVRERWPRLPVLVVSAYPEEEFAVRSIRLGAAGYVTKDSASDELVTAARRVLEGRRYLTATLAERLAAVLGGDDGHDPLELLSSRELQVLRLVASARTLREIAGELHLSEKTIATYRARISQKLGVGSSVELTRYALRHGLVQ
ncbi:response regulator [Anaeromyxobacter oryzae]|uniref:DNA-binding response regulator n=1 Tax=Anaeromyxobacter oryzae TaxID=2918170 RepID=A0ABM7X1F2_9BACT|nr:response regulator transcription factor [Anaeromyxobacter oryzae]BDG05589.1 DNA-binding response regulator [Anaeromyxobacter oryzae]